MVVNGPTRLPATNMSAQTIQFSFPNLGSTPVVIPAIQHCVGTAVFAVSQVTTDSFNLEHTGQECYVSWLVVTPGIHLLSKPGEQPLLIEVLSTSTAMCIVVIRYQIFGSFII